MAPDRCDLPHGEQRALQRHEGNPRRHLIGHPQHRLPVLREQLCLMRKQLNRAQRVVVVHDAREVCAGLVALVSLQDNLAVRCRPKL